MVAYWVFSYTYWKISLKMPVLDQSRQAKKPKTNLARIIYITQITLATITPGLVMYFYFRIVVGNPIGSLRDSEVVVVILM